MPNYYIVGNTVDPLTVDLSSTPYAGYTVITAADFSFPGASTPVTLGTAEPGDVFPGTEVVLSDSVDTDIDLRTASETEQIAAGLTPQTNVDFTFTILDNANPLTINFIPSGAIPVPTVNVLGEAPSVNVNGNATDDMTVNVGTASGDAASIGVIDGGNDFTDSMSLTVYDNATVLGTAYTSAGADTIDIQSGGEVGALLTEMGDDTITISGTAASVDAGAGSDNVTLSDATVTALTTGADADSVQITGTTVINGTLTLGDGDDTLRVTGMDTTSPATLDGGTGTDTFSDGTGTGITANGTDVLGTVDVTNFSDFVCFAAGTLILTEHGEIPVEQLKPGTLVETRDAGLQPVRWIGTNHLDAAQLAARPNLRPIRIKAGALGNGTPLEDLVVSPQHRVLVRSAIAQRLFEADEVLVAAQQLLAVEGIDEDTEADQVTYVHFLFDDHQVVSSNGALTESLYTGPQALRSVGKAALEEIFAIFPELRLRDANHRPDGARMLLSAREGRKLAQRHAANGRALMH